MRVTCLTSIECDIYDPPFLASSFTVMWQLFTINAILQKSVFFKTVFLNK